MLYNRRRRIVLTILFVCTSMLFSGIALGNEGKELGNFTFASNFQRTCFVESETKLDSFKIQRTQNLPLMLSDYENFGTGQWIIQDDDSLYFHTNTSIVKISKDTLSITHKKEINESVEGEAKKLLYSDLTYSKELDVLIGCSIQKMKEEILVLNPSTLEIIQTVNGSCFSHISEHMGVIVWNQSILYIDYTNEVAQIKALHVGGNPELLHTVSIGSVQGASLYKDNLYFVTSSMQRNSTHHTLSCFDLKEKKIVWEQEFSQDFMGVLYPVCTSSGVLFTYCRYGTMFVDLFHAQTGTLLWHSSIAYPIHLSTIWNVHNITANSTQVCLNVKTYEPWDMDYVSKIIVVSLEDGSIQREYTVTKEIKSMLQVNKTLLTTVKKGKWIGNYDIETGQIKTRLGMGENMIYSNLVFDDGTLWCLLLKEDTTFALLEMK